MTPGERDLARARAVVREELAAWKLPAADVLAALPAAVGRALAAEALTMASFPSGPEGQALSGAAYLLARLQRELGVPVDGAGYQPSAGDLVRAVLERGEATPADVLTFAAGRP